MISALVLAARGEHLAGSVRRRGRSLCDDAWVPGGRRPWPSASRGSCSEDLVEPVALEVEIPHGAGEVGGPLRLRQVGRAIGLEDVVAGVAVAYRPRDLQEARVHARAGQVVVQGVQVVAGGAARGG